MLQNTQSQPTLLDTAIYLVIEVQNMVTEWTRNSKLFTAYDVTRALREGGLKAKHESVKQVVHMLYDRGHMTTYTRSFITIPGVNAEAFIYHPIWTSASLYQTNHRSTAPTPTDDSLTSLLPDVPDSKLILNTDSDSDEVKLLRPNKARNLCIPAAMIRAIGAKPGDQVTLATSDEDGGEPELYVSFNTLTALNKMLMTLTVDYYNNVRINQSTLAHAGLIGPVYEVALLDGFVSIRSTTSMTLTETD